MVEVWYTRNVKTLFGVVPKAFTMGTPEQFAAALRFEVETARKEYLEASGASVGHAVEYGPWQLVGPEYRSWVEFGPETEADFYPWLADLVTVHRENGGVVELVKCRPHKPKAVRSSRTPASNVSGVVAESGKALALGARDRTFKSC